ncbi:MAG TPA: hypothetical protein VFS00_14150 [Polyangiaceae bacterium]|nr:hypothetical protein [Polyangiaceae bacterium]
MFARLRAPGRRPRLTALAAAPLLAALALSAACGGDDDDGGNPPRTGLETQAPPVVDDQAVEYFGGITDEALRSIVGVPPVVDDARAAALVAPAAGATMSAATVPTFTWAAQPAGAAASAARLPSAFALGAPRQAPALPHGKPYDGAAYLLSIVTTAGEPLLTALTPQTSYTPDADTWAALVATGGEVNVYLLTARCEQNAVADGGPWAPSSGPIALRLGP